MEDFDVFLLSRLKLGDESAFRNIYTRWEKPLFYFIRNIIRTEADAEDICQETFVKLWLTRESVDPEKNIKTYIFLIARQLTMNFIRDKKRKDVFSPNPDTNIGDCDTVSPEKIVEAQELTLLAEYAISKLPPRTREIYNMHYKDNLSYEQIAEMLDTNVVNIKTQIYQARKKIREIIYVMVTLMFP